MGSYRGNVGHLMQHWTLCELLCIAGKRTTGLNFIDAHAMAPLATENDGKDKRFARVERRLSNEAESCYERAWHRLAPYGGYPNSAVFVKEVWKGDFSLLLCEIDDSTIKEIDCWLPSVHGLERCKRARRFHGDWRKKFAEGLASPSADGLSDGALTLVSFDPNMYNRRRKFVELKKKKGSNPYPKLYPDDICLALSVMNALKGGILIQLSTYDTNDDNPQGGVISSVNSIMVAESFTLSAVVRVDRSMMSLVYARNVPWAAELADLPDRFTKWLP